MKKSFLSAAVFLLLCSACSTSKSYPLELATFVKNSVSVSIYLEKDTDATYFFSATFTPEPGFHLYSKDLPITGADGLGRPTLIEAGAESQYHVTGKLLESVPAEIPKFEPKNLLVYPVGAVTLRLPIELPPGNSWVDDTVRITYMACSDRGCKAPVIGQEIPIQIPAKETSH
ncbi:MAG: hypothetical protein U0V18_03530 [Anaerolineales bacterium]